MLHCWSTLDTALLRPPIDMGVPTSATKRRAAATDKTLYWIELDVVHAAARAYCNIARCDSDGLTLFTIN